jgi:hypothetical protein
VALLAPLVGAVVVPVVAVVVYVDATRRDCPRRALWTGGVAALSLLGVLLPAVAGDVLHRAYLHWVKPAPVVASPLEMLFVDVAVGLVVTGLALVGYVAATRH